MRIQLLGEFFLVASLSGGAAAGEPRCAQEPTFPPSAGICLTLVDDGWYQVNLRPLHAAPDLAAGIAGEKAISLSGDAGTGNGKRGPGWGSPNLGFIHGGLERRIPLESWRGKRLSLTLRLKNEDGAHAWASVQVNKANDTALRTSTRFNSRNDAWQGHTFTLDVPDNATDMFVMAGMTGKGRTLLDGFTLQAVGREVPVSWSRRDNYCGQLWPQSEGGAANFCFAMQREPNPAPGPTRRDGL